jgi:hypothetical protein
MYKELAKNVCPLPLSDVKKNYQVTEGKRDSATQTPPPSPPLLFSLVTYYVTGKFSQQHLQTSRWLMLVDCCFALTFLGIGLNVLTSIK